MELGLVDTIEFEEWLRKLPRHLSESTVHMYVAAIKTFILSIPKSTDLDKFLVSVDSYNQFIYQHAVLKRSTYVYDALKLFITWKLDKFPGKGTIIRNLLKPRLLNPKKVTKFLPMDSRKDIVSLLKNDKHRVIAMIQLVTGARAGDVFRLKHSGVQYESYKTPTGTEIVAMTLTFESKGRQTSVKYIFDENIQSYIDIFYKFKHLDPEYLFLERRKGVPWVLDMKYNYLRYLRDLKQAVGLAGEDVKLWATHDFRRGIAQDVWAATKDPLVVKNVLGHKRFDTTQRYLDNSGLSSRDALYHVSKQ